MQFSNVLLAVLSITVESIIPSEVFTSTGWLQSVSQFYLQIQDWVQIHWGYPN